MNERVRNGEDLSGRPGVGVIEVLEGEKGTDGGIIEKQ